MDLDIKKINDIHVKMTFKHIMKMQEEFPQSDIIGSFLKGLFEGRRERQLSQENQSQQSQQSQPEEH